MKAVSSKFFNTLFSFVLAFGMIPIPAYANAGEDTSKENIEEVENSSENVDVEEMDDTDIASLENEYRENTPDGYRYAGLDDGKAVYEAKEYTISYINAYSEDTDSEKITFDEKELVLPSVPEIEGYSFIGWSTTPDGQDIEDDPSTKEVDESVYAATFKEQTKFSKKLELSYDVNRNNKIDKGEKISLLSYDDDGEIVLYAVYEEDVAKNADTSTEDDSGVLRNSEDEDNAVSTKDAVNDSDNTAQSAKDNADQDTSSADDNAASDDGNNDADQQAATVSTQDDSAAKAKDDTRQSNAKTNNSSDDTTNSQSSDEDDATKNDNDAVVDDDSLFETSQLSSTTKKALANKIKPLAAASNASFSFEPITVNGTTLANLRMHWLTPSTGQSEPAGTDRLYLTPKSDTIPGHQFQLDFQLSGKDRYEPGDIEITLPLSIWTDRYGKVSMELNADGLSVPEAGSPGVERASFSYKIIDDKVVITNNRRMPAASAVMIQGHFEGEYAHNIVDMTISDPMWCTVSVVTQTGEELTGTSNSIDAQLDTYQLISAANKTAYSSSSRSYWVYDKPPADMPDSFIPDNPDDYIYVKWYVSGRMDGNQPATIKIQDDADDTYQGIMLGAQGTADGNIVSTDGRSIEATLFEGYDSQIHSAYVWTAYPIEAFPVPGVTYNIPNTVVVSTTGVDDELTTEKTASATVPVIPPTVYTVVKDWDDNDDESGYRPEDTNITVWRSATGSTGSYTPYKQFTLDEQNNWSAKWRDEDLKAWHYKVSEFEGQLVHGYYTAQTGTRTYTLSKEEKPGIQEDPRIYTSPVFDEENNVFWSYKFEGVNFDNVIKTYTVNNKLYTKEPQTHRIVKRWLNDNDDEDGNRPETLKVWVAKDLVMLDSSGNVALAGATHDWVNFAQNNAWYANTYYDEDGYLVSGKWIELTLVDDGTGNYVGYFEDDDPYDHRYSVHEFSDLRDYGGHKLLGRTLISGGSRTWYVINNDGSKTVYTTSAWAYREFDRLIDILDDGEDIRGAIDSFDLENFYVHPGTTSTTYPVIPWKVSGNSSSISKWSPTYTENYDKSKHGETYLNNVLNGVPSRNEPLSFRVAGTSYHEKLAMDGYTVDDRNKSDVTVELTDNGLTLDSRQLGVGDYKINSVSWLTSPVKTAERTQSDAWSSWTWNRNIIPYYSYETDTSNGYTSLYSSSNSADAGGDYTAVLEGLVDGQWVKYADIIRENNRISVSADNGATATNTSVKFPEEVAVLQTRIRATSKASAMTILYDLQPELLNSQTISNITYAKLDTKDYASYDVGNTVTIKVFEGTDTQQSPKVTRMAESHEYVHAKNQRVGVTLDKTFKMVSNDKVLQRIKVHTKLDLTQQSNITDAREWREAREDNILPIADSGIWYDLIPEGILVDINSVKTASGDSVKDVWLVENYNNTGRTLLCVKIDFGAHESKTTLTTPRPDSIKDAGEAWPSEGYKTTQTLEFDAWYPWDLARVFGTDVRNIAAFESDISQLANLTGYSGEPDDPSAGEHVNSLDAVKWYKDDITDLDPNRDDNAFVYAGTPLVPMILDFYADAGITKEVALVGSDEWGTGRDVYPDVDPAVNVPEDGAYMYRYTTRADSTAVLKNIVILDSLENYQLNREANEEEIEDGIEKGWIEDDGSEEPETTQWHGRLTSLYLNNLREIGIEPVVYYSTAENLDVASMYRDVDGEKEFKYELLEDTSIWIQGLPDDTSEVRAIAIDCRDINENAPEKNITTDGKFQLLPEEYFYWIAYMRAPKDASGYIVDSDGDGIIDGKDASLNAHAYNNVFMASTNVNPIGDETLNYIHNDYTKVGIYSNQIEVKKIWDDDNNRDGVRPSSIQVELVANGQPSDRVGELNEDNGFEYIFEHVPSVDGDNNHIEYSYQESSIEGYELTNISSEDGVVSITNTHLPEQTSYPAEKIWVGDENDLDDRPSSITFDLYADGQKLDISKNVTAATDWKTVFDNIPKYRDGGVEIIYTVKERNIANGLYVANTQDSPDKTTITNTYHPFGDLTVSKTILNGSSASDEKDFIFTFNFYDQDNNDLPDEFAYTTSDGRDGHIRNGQTLSLKGGQSITVHELPASSKYSVSEQSESGYRTIANNNNGTISANKEAEATFTNVYSTRGSYQPSVDKILNNKQLTRGLFRFEMLDENDNVVRTASNTIDATKTDIRPGTEIGVERSGGVATFGTFQFTNDDDGKTFTYKIKEIDSGKEYFDYDDSVYTLKMTPHDNADGTMTVEAVWLDSDDNELSTKPTFENTYEASGEIKLKAWKELTGRGLKDKEFTFELLEVNEDGHTHVIQTKDNDANGDINWDTLTFTQDDIGKTYIYLAREIQGNDNSIDYDDATFAYEIHVVDNGNGTLSFSQHTIDGSHASAICETCDGIGKIVREVEFGGGFTILNDGMHKYGLGGVSTNAHGIVKRGDTITFNHDEALAEINDSLSIFNGTVNTESRADNPDLTDIQYIVEITFGGMPYVFEFRGTTDTINNNTHIDDRITLADEFIPEDKVSDWLDRGIILEIVSNVAGPTVVLDFDFSSGYPNLPKVKVTDIYYDFSALQDSYYSQPYRPWNADPLENPTSLSEVLFLQSQEKDNLLQPLLRNFTIDYYSGADAYAISPLDPEDEWMMENAVDCLDCNGSGITIHEPIEEEEFIVPLFTNIAKPGDLAIEKHIKNGDADTEFKFHVQLSGDNIEDNQTYDYNIAPLSSITAKSVSNSITKLCNSIFVNNKAYADNYTSNGSSISWYINNSTLIIQPISGDTGILNYNPRGQQNVNPPWYDKRSSIRWVRIDGTIQLQGSIDNLFKNCSRLTALDLSNFDTSNVTSMQNVFDSLNALASLNISSWNTSQVTNMSYMFTGCNKLASLDLSNFDTSKVTDMSYMFQYCSNLMTLDISNFDTSQVTTFYSMFSSCPALKSVKLGKDFSFISKATYSNRGTLPYPPSGKWVIDDYSLEPLTNQKLRDTYDGTTMAGTWIWVEAPIAVFDSSDGSLKFYNATTAQTFEPTSAQTVYNVNLDVYSPTYSVPWSSKRSSVVSVEVVDNGISPISTAFWFSSMPNLTSCNLSKLDTSKVTNMQSMFSGSSNITSLDLSNFDTSNVSDMSYMFNKCSELNTLDLFNFDTSKATNMLSMFNECTNLESINLGTKFNFKGQNITAVNNQALLPDPPTDLTTGKWKNVDKSLSSLTATQLRNTYNGSTMAGLWTWEEKPPVYANVDGVDTGIEVKRDDWISKVPFNDQIIESSVSGLIAYRGYLKPIGYGYTVYRGGPNVGYIMGFNNGWRPTQHTLDMGQYGGSDYYNWYASWVDTLVLSSDATSEQEETFFDKLVSDNKLMLRTIYLPVQKIAYDSNGGMGSMPEDYRDFFDTYDIRNSTFVKAGHHQTGWIDSDGNTYNMDGTIEALATNIWKYDLEPYTITLSAIWEPNVATIQNGGFDITIKGNEKALIENIPAGISYSVYEETPAGWVLVAQSDTTGIIQPLETSIASFTNDYQPDKTSAMIVGFKTIDGRTADSDGYSFELVDSNNNVIETVESTNGGTIQFSPLIFDEVGQHTYTVREVVGNNRTIDYDKHEEQITITITESDGKLTSSVIYDDDGVRFDNKVIPGDLVIRKNIVGGNDKNKDTQFVFKVKLSDGKGGDLGNVSVETRDATSSGTITAASIKQRIMDFNNMLDCNKASAAIVEEQEYLNRNSSIIWGIDDNGTLVIKPISGDTGILNYTQYEQSASDFPPWYRYASSITDVRIEGTINLAGFASNLFNGCRMTSLDLSNINANSARTINGMLTTSTLHYLDLTGFRLGGGSTARAYIFSSPLQSVTLGPYFSFIGYGSWMLGQYYDNNKTQLPTPPAGITTGKWVIEDKSLPALTPAELRDTYNSTMAGTWVWEMAEDAYVVNFDPNGGILTGNSSVSKSNIAEAQAFNITQEPTRYGYFFRGWNTEKDGSGTRYQIGDSYLPTLNQIKTLYAQWEKDTRVGYIVEVYQQPTNMSDNHDDYVRLSSKKVDFVDEPGTTITVEPEAIAGFIAPSSQTIELTDDSQIIKLYYDRIQYDIAYDKNGADYGDNRIQHFLGGIKDNLFSNWLRKFGSIFLGWSDTPTGDVVFSDGQEVLNVADDGDIINLFARWLDNSENIKEATNGEYEIVIKGGQEAVLHDLPAGTTYEIVETGILNDDGSITPLPARGWTQTSSTDENGIIPSNDIATASFENTYAASGEFSIETWKHLSGRTLKPGEFSFTLYEAEEYYDDETCDSYYYATNVVETVENEAPSEQDRVGDGAIKFSPIEVSKAGKYLYLIREISGGTDDIIYDYDDHIVEVNMTDDGNGVLWPSYSWGGYYGDTDDTFYNSLRKTSLNIAKAIENATSVSAKKTFTFDITLIDAEGNPVLADDYNVNKLSADLPSGIEASGETSTSGFVVSPGEDMIKFDANGGRFEDNDARYNFVGVSTGIAPRTIKKYSSTPNINKRTGVANSVYANNLALNDIVTIEDAESLSIEVWFATESERWDWLAIYPDGVVPSASNFNDATISGGKLAGSGYYTGYARPNNSDATYHRTFTVDGNTAQFFFRSDGSGAYYGYHAIISATVVSDGSVVSDGVYSQPLPPSSGKTFGGWYTDAACTDGNEFDLDSYILQGDTDLTVYAKWIDDRTTESVPVQTEDGKLTVELRGGEEITIDNLPIGTTYEIVERSADGWENISHENETGVLGTNMTSSSFTNRYSSYGEANIEVSKIFSGSEILNNGQFEFELRDELGNLLQTSYNTSDGKVIFDPIPYTEQDHNKTYTYYVYEVEGTDPTVEYDTSAHEVSVSVSDKGNGEMDCRVSYGGQSSPTEIINKYLLDLPFTGKDYEWYYALPFIVLVTGSAWLIIRKRKERRLNK